MTPVLKRGERGPAWIVTALLGVATLAAASLAEPPLAVVEPPLAYDVSPLPAGLDSLTSLEDAARGIEECADDCSGIVYFWSPRMPLSRSGIVEISGAARRLGMRLTLVGTEEVHEYAYADPDLRAGVIPIADAMLGAGALAHAPAVVVHDEGQVVGHAILGYKTAYTYEGMIGRRLSGAMSSCLADGALARGFNEVTFDAQAGEDYFLVIDGYDGDQGRFEAELECENDWAQPPAPPSYPTPDAPIAGNSCQGIDGLWDTDSIEPIARCKSVLQPSIPDLGWFSDSDPSMSVPQADLCLARSTWGYNNHPYYVLSGTIYAQGGYSSGERIFYETFWAGQDGGDYGLEDSNSIDLRSDQPSAAIIEANGRWVTEAVFDKYADTLHVRQGFDPMFGGFELDYQFLTRCARF